jgi:hypothetical protein
MLARFANARAADTTQKDSALEQPKDKKVSKKKTKPPPPPPTTDKKAAKKSGDTSTTTSTASSQATRNDQPQQQHHSTTAGTFNQEKIQDPYAHAESGGWKLKEMKFNGSGMFVTMGKKQEVKGIPIKKGIDNFIANPEKYVALMYQTDMKWRPHSNQVHTLIHRKGTKNYEPVGIDNEKGLITLLVYEYERLPRFPDNILPVQFRDKYTDTVLSTFRGRKLQIANINPPIMPGRGMGVCDTPNLKIIGNVDPSDITQGSIGDCWLLSAISALAEFDGAIKRLFRKTKNLHEMPRGNGNGNMYTITLWDLKTWKEVDIVVDERLCANANCGLLASKPSQDGELWVCYLEKAIAAHCNGWDKIVGGQCTHAWSLLTGCKKQYSIHKNTETGKFECFAKYNPREKKWIPQHSNSPRGDASSQVVWQVPFPKVGGGKNSGGDNMELTRDELFQCMCAWDNANYIIGTSTESVSHKSDEKDEGLVDCHAYSVLEAIKCVAGTDIDLIKVRNPWSKGEIQSGMFDDDGPGWDKYPQIKKHLNPVEADDGIFWVTKKEFFKFFNTIYLSASSMTEFIED